MSCVIATVDNPNPLNTALYSVPVVTAAALALATIIKPPLEGCALTHANTPLITSLFLLAVCVKAIFCIP